MLNNRLSTTTIVAVFVALIVATVLILGAGAQPVNCGYFESDRPHLGGDNRQCPYRVDTTIQYTDHETSIVINGTTHTSTVTHAKISGGIGWCSLQYNYPIRTTYNQADPAYYTDIWGNATHSVRFSLPIPWCATEVAFGGRLEPRVDNWHPLSVAYGVRPIGSLPHRATCGSNISLGIPERFSLWDDGGYYDRVATVSITDTFNHNTAIGSDPGIPRYTIVAPSATIIDNGGNESISTGSRGLFYWWGATEQCGASAERCDVCKGECDSMFSIECDAEERETPLRQYPVKISLACRDAFWGYLWRVENPKQNPNLHIDWEQRRTLDGSLVNVLPILDMPPYSEVQLPFTTDTLEWLRMPYLTVDYVPLVGSRADKGTFDLPLWPNATYKHQVCSGCQFFVPTFVDTSAIPGSTGLGNERPSHFTFYAGRPNHYAGTVALAAFVAFFDVPTLLAFDVLEAEGYFNLTILAEEATFPEDNVRLAVLTLCSNDTMINVTQDVLGSLYNVTRTCESLLDEHITWPDLLDVLREDLLPGGLAVIDPVPQCNCQEIECGSGGASSNVNRPRVLYDIPIAYPQPPPPPPPILIEPMPVCRMTLPHGLSNVMPPPEIETTPGGYSAGYFDMQQVARIVPPLDVIEGQTDGYFGQLVNYSTSPLGVLWRLNNNDMDTSHSSVRIRWEFGETADGNILHTPLVTVPYIRGSATDLGLPSKTSHWLFSRTTRPHALYGNMRLGCVTPDECAAVEPKNPPPASWNATNTLLRNISQAQIDALPTCSCGTTMPCIGTRFIFSTAVDADLANLTVPSNRPPAPPPIPPVDLDEVEILPGCFPAPEVCNGLDDNCDGLVDNVPGLDLPCISNYPGGLCNLYPGVLRCNLSSGELYCEGAAKPTEERCDMTDHDCDGIPCNPRGIGRPCGSDVGRCKMGILTCATCQIYDLMPDCIGEIGPIPEICGNGIDDDCNGIVDDGCENATLPSPVPLPPGFQPPPHYEEMDPEDPYTPPGLWDAIIAVLAWLGINVPALSFDPLPLFFILILFVATCIATCCRYTNYTTTYHYSLAPDDSEEADDDDDETFVDAPVYSAARKKRRRARKRTARGPYAIKID